jgi:hypothetical protein
MDVEQDTRSVYQQYAWTLDICFKGFKRPILLDLIGCTDIFTVNLKINYSCGELSGGGLLISTFILICWEKVIFLECF